MDNGQIPQVQPTVPVNTSGMPMVQQVQVAPEIKHNNSDFIKTLVIVIVSIVAAAFIGLFIWMFLQYNEVKDDVDGQIAKAVAEAKNAQATEDEAEFLEREKNPYKIFSGPVDYGELNFEYPKTWSVYIAKDAANGGDFEAYLNPGQVDSISSSNVYALRVQILDKSFDSVVNNYQSYLGKKDRALSLESVTINDSVANLYSGAIPSTDYNGFILVFKIRDKAAVLRTDSVLFKDDFDRLMQTIKFNS